MTKANEALLEHLHAAYPDAKCTLDFKNPFECLIAISLSAQTNDKSVNLVTPTLFKDFPTPEALAKAPLKEVEHDIQSLGLYHSKATHIIQLAGVLQGKFNSNVPLKMDELTSLPGVGSKTAGVFLMETIARPAIPVDTHVTRVSIRLGYAKEGDEPLVIEKKLEKIFPESEWIFLHHALIAFGRQECHAKKPACGSCPLKNDCRYFKKNLSTIGK
jgi:endonuclease-3